MGDRRWRLLDNRLDVVARTSWEILTVRLLIGAGAAALAAQAFGPLFGAVWFAAFAATEGATRFVSRAGLSGGSLTPAQRTAYLGGMFLAGLVWCWLAVRCWTAGDEALRLTGMAILVTLMIHAAGF